jgi:hypothetical protein
MDQGRATFRPPSSQQGRPSFRHDAEDVAEHIRELKRDLAKVSPRVAACHHFLCTCPQAACQKILLLTNMPGIQAEKEKEALRAKMQRVEAKGKEKDRLVVEIMQNRAHDLPKRLTTLVKECVTTDTANKVRAPSSPSAVRRRSPPRETGCASHAARCSPPPSLPY